MPEPGELNNSEVYESGNTSWNVKTTRQRSEAVSRYANRMNAPSVRAIISIKVPLERARELNMLSITKNVLPNIPKNLSASEIKNLLYLLYFYYNLADYINRQGYEIHYGLEMLNSYTYEFNAYRGFNDINIKVAYNANDKVFKITITSVSEQLPMLNEITRILQQYFRKSNIPGEGGRRKRSTRRHRKTKSRRSRK